MRSTKSWGGGYSLFNCWGGGAFRGRGGGVRKSTNFIGGGGSLYHCVTCGGGV